MNRYVVYIIHPRRELITEIYNRNPEWVCLLCRTSIIERTETAHLSLPIEMWRTLREQQVKVTYLLQLAKDFGLDDLEENDFKPFLRDLLEIPNVTTSVFERWWHLERVDEGLINYSESIEGLSSEILSWAQPPNEELGENWLLVGKIPKD